MIPLARFWEIAQLSASEELECIAMVAKVMIMSDQQIQEAIQKHMENTTLPETITLHQGLPYYGDRVYVPKNQDIRQQIMALYHDSPIAGHLGQQGTTELIRRTYWWPHMITTIRDYIRSCHTCAKNKHTNQATPGTLVTLPTPDGPWEWTQSDHITGLP